MTTDAAGPHPGWPKAKNLWVPLALATFVAAVVSYGLYGWSRRYQQMNAGVSDPLAVVLPAA